MRNSISTPEESGDLFGNIPTARGAQGVKDRFSPELTAARALCLQIRRKRAPMDKQRIAHLICLNLASMLKQEK